MQVSYSFTQPINYPLQSSQYSLGLFYKEISNRGLNASQQFSKHVEDLLFDEETVQGFVTGAELFFAHGGNPNLLFPNISLAGDNQFYSPTFFHVVYLAWKWPDADWSPEIDDRFDRLIEQMLDDPRTDLTARFSEESLCDCEHFAYFISPYGTFDGFIIERMTLVHYAMAIGDIKTVEKLLLRAPSLLDTVCCLTQGKNLLNEQVLSVASCNEKDMFGRVIADKDTCCFSERYDQNYKHYLARVQNLMEDDEIAGDLAWATEDIKNGLSFVTRTVKVTLLHIAARNGDEAACGFLRGKGINVTAVDSDRKNPLDSFRSALSDGRIDSRLNTKRLFKILEPIMQLQRTVLPRTFEVRELEGYEIYYDTRLKVAAFIRERLTQQSLIRRTQRDSLNFKVDPKIHHLHRAKHADYTNSGYDRGHLRPAADSVSSEQCMEDSFLFTNICPQLPGFNRNYWKWVEGCVRELVYQYDLVTVYSGPIFAPQMFNDGKMRVCHETIGGSGLSVATHFFKVLFLQKGRMSTQKAYVFPHVDIPYGTPLNQFEVSVEKVQELSGILFSELSRGMPKVFNAYLAQ